MHDKNIKANNLVGLRTNKIHKKTSIDKNNSNKINLFASK